MFNFRKNDKPNNLVNAVEQNIFDNSTFFDGYKKLRESDTNSNDLLEQPAMRKLIPDLNGKSVIDLGCGYGHNCNDFVKRGADCVTGIDISDKMLDIAKTENADTKITYIKMSMDKIGSLNRKFDFIYSSLAFHYIEDFDAFAKSLYQSLNDGGILLFSQEHPIITSTIDGKGHFNKDKHGNKISYTFSDYHKPGKRTVTWYVDGVIKYHRTFSDVVNALANAGFIIEQIVEPLPEEWAIQKLPALAKEYIKPNFLIIRAKK